MNTIEQDLDNLGDTPTKVAEELRKLGIKGVRQEPKYCPIFKYLHLQGHTEVVGVSGEEIIVGDRDGFDIYPPTPVSVFIRQFDTGDYPDLEVE